MYPYAPDIGGIQTHSYYLYNHLINFNFEVLAFTLSDKSHINDPRVYPFKSSSLSDAVKSSQYIVNILNSNKTDLIHVHFNRELSMVAYLVNAHNSAPIIASFHDDPYFAENELINNPIVERFLSDTIRKMELIIVHSEYVAKGVRDFFSLPEDKVKVIPYGIDIQKFVANRSLDFKQFSFIKKNYINIICPARYSLQKGLVKFIQNIFKIKGKIPSFHFILLGEGLQKHKLESEIERLSLRNIITLVDSIPYNSMPEVYNAADAVILPSLYEPVGIVLLEAMACEKPVIASNVGGIPEVIKHLETGILFDPENYSELAIYLNLLSDSSFRKTIGKKGRNRVCKYFNVDNMVNNFIKIYRNFI